MKTRKVYFFVVFVVQGSRSERWVISCVSPSFVFSLGDTFVFIFSTDHKQTTSFPLPASLSSLSLLQFSISKKLYKVWSRTYLVAERGERARGGVKKETTSTRSRGWAEGGFDHPPSGSSGPHHGAGTEGRHRATSPLDEVMPSRWRRISAQQQKTTMEILAEMLCGLGRPAFPRQRGEKKKRVGAREHLEVRGDPRRARLVASGGREVPPEGRTRSLRRWLRPPVLAAAAGPGTHGAGLKEVDRFYSSLRLDPERGWIDDRGDDSIVAERYGF